MELILLMHLPFSCRMYLRILPILAVLGLAQCNKSAAPVAVATSPGVTLVTEGSSPHFQAVASKLDVGGASFTYAEEENVMGLMGTFFEEIFKNMPEKEKAKLPPNFSFKKMMNMTGLDSIKAGGTSSRKVSEGMNHHRSFAYTPEGRKGFLTLTGGPAEPLLAPALAPQDTDLALEFPLHLKDLVAEAWPVILESTPKEQRAMLEAMASAPQPALGMSYREMAEKLSVRVALFATMMPEQSLSGPGARVSLPGVDAAIVIDKLGWIKDVLKAQVLPMLQSPGSPVEVQEVNGALVGRFRGPMGPPPMDFQPAFHLDAAGDRLIIATRPGYYDALMETDGKLSSQPDFARVWKGMPAEGNGCLFLSKRLMTAVFDGIKAEGAASVAKATGKDKAGSEMAMSLINMISSHARYPQAFFFANQPDGILSVSNSSIPTMNPGSFSSITTLAVLSSLAVPVFTTMQQRGAQVKTLSNGRQVLIALKTHAAGNGGKYPEKLQELITSGALTKPELLTVASGPGAEPKPWLYDSTLTPQSPGITIVLAAPEVSKGSGGKQTRVVIRNDGRAEALPEEDFQRVKDYYLR